MNDDRKSEPSPEDVQKTCRLVGPAAIGAGLMLAIFGLADILRSLANRELSQFLWFVALGPILVLLGVGLLRRSRCGSPDAQ